MLVQRPGHRLVLREPERFVDGAHKERLENLAFRRLLAADGDRITLRLGENEVGDVEQG